MKNQRSGTLGRSAVGDVKGSKIPIRLSSVNAMDISLTKLPWYAQVGAFVVLAWRGVGAFYYYYEKPARADMTARQTQLQALQGRHHQGLRDREDSCRSSGRRSQISKERLENLKSVLPEEKDAADLLRRLQTVADAVEPDDHELQAGADGDETAARRVADHVRARRHVSQPGGLLRPGRKVHADRQYQRARREG